MQIPYNGTKVKFYDPCSPCDKEGGIKQHKETHTQADYGVGTYKLDITVRSKVAAWQN